MAQPYAQKMIPGEFEAAQTDLERAQKTFDEHDFKWSTIQAYYSMFHSARALLFAKGYREKSHICLKYALQSLYVEEGILEERYANDFDVVMLLRETADYKSDFSKDGAKTAIQNAKTFSSAAKKVLSDLGKES